jgi:hypothetical protein
MKNLLLLLLVAGCGPGVKSEEEARRAYLGLDPSIDKGITLGFAGFNSASSANIAPQSTTGVVSGTMTVTGQVDQGSSNNKGMRLIEALVMYSDDGKLSYATDMAAQPKLDLSLKKIPDGTLEGTLAGTFNMSGELEGQVTLALVLTATLQPNAADATKVERRPGTTHITGTATSPAGVYNVDITR